MTAKRCRGAVGVDMARRTLLSTGLVASTSAAVIVGTRELGAADKPTLAVFVVTEIHSRALQDSLASGFPAFEVIAFSRVRDFERKLRDNPAAVIAMGNLLRDKNLKVVASGRTASGSAIEPYVVMSLIENTNLGKLATVGVIDILGRAGMERVAAQLVGGAPRVERVAKVQDLLPLLQLKAADAVLLPERLVPTLQARSVQKLYIARARGGLELPALAGSSSATSALHKLDAAVNRLLGVSQWA